MTGAITPHLYAFMEFTRTYYSCLPLQVRINLFITKSKQAYCYLDIKFKVLRKKLAFYFLSYCFARYVSKSYAILLISNVRTVNTTLRCRPIIYFNII
jgi:hypothetical protein